MEELRERVQVLQAEVEPHLSRAWAEAIENQAPNPLEFIAERLLAHSGAIQVTRAADRLSRRSSATDEGAEQPPSVEEPSAPVDETGGADADTPPADRASRRSSSAGGRLPPLPEELPPSTLLASLKLGAQP